MESRSILNVEPIRGKPFDCVANVLLLIVESRGESEFINKKVEFLVVADGADDLSTLSISVPGVGSTAYVESVPHSNLANRLTDSASCSRDENDLALLRLADLVQ